MEEQEKDAMGDVIAESVNIIQGGRPQCQGDPGHFAPGGGANRHRGEPGYPTGRSSKSAG